MKSISDIILQNSKPSILEKRKIKKVIKKLEGEKLDCRIHLDNAAYQFGSVTPVDFGPNRREGSLISVHLLSRPLPLSCIGHEVYFFDSKRIAMKVEYLDACINNLQENIDQLTKLLER